MAEKREELRGQLKELAQEIVSSLSGLDPEQSRELLGGFVSDLFLSVAEQSRKEERRQKQGGPSLLDRHNRSAAAFTRGLPPCSE